MKKSGHPKEERTCSILTDGEYRMSKQSKKGGSNTKQNKGHQPKHKTSGSANGQNGYH
ncbi:hypothetical protein ACTWKB_13940 [Bacillus sp. 4A_MP2]